MKRWMWMTLAAVLVVGAGVTLVALPGAQEWTTSSPEALAEYEAGWDALMKVYRDQAQEHFRRADEINQGKLLMVELLQAEYLYRQQLNRTAFHDKLQYILDAPQGLYPEMALVNAICKQRAVYLLALEDEWF